MWLKSFLFCNFATKRIIPSTYKMSDKTLDKGVLDFILASYCYEKTSEFFLNSNLFVYYLT